MYKEKVSIILPAYNSQNCIERCVSSIVEQSYNNIEVIIIDDGSNDRTGEMCDIIAMHDKRVIVKHIENSGVSNARNEGLRIATGKYVQFVDSDDIVDKNMTKRLVDRIQCDNSDIVICGYNQYIGNQSTKISATDGNYSYEEFLKIMVRWMTEPFIGAPWNKLFKREIIEQYSLSFDTTTSYAEDYLFNISYFGYVHSISVIKDTLYSYFIVNNNSLHNVNLNDIEHVWNVNKRIFDLNVKNMKMQNVEDLNYRCSLYNFLFNTNVISRVRTYNKDDVIDWICSNYNPIYSKYNKRYLDFLFFPRANLMGVFIKGIAKKKAINFNYRLIELICNK